jgi:DNA invertase Pin-like site-specific DNA recombinase
MLRSDYNVPHLSAVSIVQRYQDVNKSLAICVVPRVAFWHDLKVEATKQTRAFGYIRVSSAGQAAEDRDGYKRQEAAVRAWAKSHGVRIVRWFRESISGTTNPLERPAFQEMLTALHSNGVKLVICEKYDRVARDSMWIEWAIRHLSENGFSLVSASEPELADDSDPHRKAMRGMISIFAELEKSALVLKLRAARQRAKASRRDYREGRKPFGARPGEEQTIARIRDLRSQGLAYDAIAERLNAEKLPARAGRWHATSVSRVLKSNS